VAPSLGRSGQQFQLSYNLKTIAPPKEAQQQTSSSPWARRQCAVHHQFDMVHGTALWILTAAYETLKLSIQDLLPSDGLPPDLGFDTIEACFKTSLAVHLVHCRWSMDHWRWYLQWLEEAVDTLVRCTLHPK
jgi:hypothetical protein